MNYIEERKLAEKEAHERYLEMINNDLKVINRLKKTVKPRIFKAIMAYLEQSWYQDLKIVEFPDVCGKFEKPKDVFGESTPIRKSYSTVTTDYFGDGYSGDVYLPIGSGRWLKAFIWG